MLPDLTSIWSWLPPLLLATLKVFNELGLFGHTKPAQDRSVSVQTKTISLQKIEQREPDRHPPRFVAPVLMTCAGVLLAFGIYAIILWISGAIQVQVDFRIVLFFVWFSGAFVGFPLYMLWDHCYTQRKYDRRGISHVAKAATVTAADDVDTVFDACYGVLSSMEAAIIRLEKPNLLKARIRNCLMTILIGQIEESKTRIYVLSDSKWLTIKWDRGANQRNIDAFLGGLSKLHNCSS